MKRYIKAEYIPDMTERYPEGLRTAYSESAVDLYSSELRPLTRIEDELFLISKSKYASHIESNDSSNPYWAEATYPGEGEYFIYCRGNAEGRIPDVYDTQHEYDLAVAEFLHRQHN